MIPTNPHAIIKINGTRYDSWRDPQLFKQVTVELTTNRASEALVRVFDPNYQFLNRFTAPDGVRRTEISFWLGFGAELGEPVFDGLLARIERNETDTTLRAYDRGYQMRGKMKSEYHNNLSDLEIIEKMARRNGLEFVGPDRAVPHERHSAMIQHGQHDWHHAKERARASGLVLYVRGNTLYAKEAARTAEGEPLLTLNAHGDARLLRSIDFSYKLPENAGGRPAEVEVRGRARAGKRLTGKSHKHERGTKTLFLERDLEIHTKSYADRRAHASKQLQREHAFSCTVRTIPLLPTVRADVRNTIALVNYGELFSGKYLIDTVRHDLVATGFATEYMLYRDMKV